MSTIQNVVGEPAAGEPCPFCLADPQPRNFGSPRKCAFRSGVFSPENWSCAALDKLSLAAKTLLYGDDETCAVLSVPDVDDLGARTTFGWIVLSRYKSRGCCSSAVHVGDFFPPEVLTLDLAERVIGLLPQDKDEDEGEVER